MSDFIIMDFLSIEGSLTLAWFCHTVVLLHESEVTHLLDQRNDLKKCARYICLGCQQQLVWIYNFLEVSYVSRYFHIIHKWILFGTKHTTITHSVMYSVCVISMAYHGHHSFRQEGTSWLGT